MRQRHATRAASPCGTCPTACASTHSRAQPSKWLQGLHAKVSGGFVIEAQSAPADGLCVATYAARRLPRHIAGDCRAELRDHVHQGAIRFSTLQRRRWTDRTASRARPADRQRDAHRRVVSRLHLKRPLAIWQRDRSCAGRATKGHEQPSGSRLASAAMARADGTRGASVAQRLACRQRWSRAQPCRTKRLRAAACGSHAVRLALSGPACPNAKPPSQTSPAAPASSCSQMGSLSLRLTLRCEPDRSQRGSWRHAVHQEEHVSPCVRHRCASQGGRTVHRRLAQPAQLLRPVDRGRAHPAPHRL